MSCITDLKWLLLRVRHLMGSSFHNRIEQGFMKTAWKLREARIIPQNPLMDRQTNGRTNTVNYITSLLEVIGLITYSLCRQPWNVGLHDGFCPRPNIQYSERSTALVSYLHERRSLQVLSDIIAQRRCVIRLKPIVCQRLKQTLQLWQADKTQINECNNVIATQHITAMDITGVGRGSELWTTPSAEV